MSENEQSSRIETFLYDADGNRTEDESVAVRGEVVELDAAGRVIARHAHEDLGGVVDRNTLEGDPGELATRPKHEAT
jgi:uncharacterized protein RhaS with RHS repeats